MRTYFKILDIFQVAPTNVHTPFGNGACNGVLSRTPLRNGSSQGLLWTGQYTLTENYKPYTTIVNAKTI